MTPADDPNLYVRHTEFSEFRSEQREFNGAVLKKLDAMGKTNPVNWGWVFAGVSMLGVFIMLYTGPSQDKIDHHVDLPGHTAALVADASHEKDLETLRNQVERTNENRFTAQQGEDFDNRISRIEATVFVPAWGTQRAKVAD